MTPSKHEYEDDLLEEVGRFRSGTDRERPTYIVVSIVRSGDTSRPAVMMARTYYNADGSERMKRVGRLVSKEISGLADLLYKADSKLKGLTDG